MKYYEGVDFAMADIQRKSRNVKKNVPFYYGLQFIFSGEIELSVDRNRAFRGHGAVAFLTCPEHYYEYNSPGTATRDHYWVCFNGPKVKQYWAEGLFCPNPDSPLVALRQPELFRNRMEELIDLVQCKREHDKAVCLLEYLLFTVRSEAENARPEAPDYYRAPFSGLLAEIEKNPEKQWDFAKESRRFHVSLNYFNRLFRKYHRTSPRHCVIELRMRKAAELLLRTGASVREIASTVGIDNEFYFSRLFKRHFGLAPCRYRLEFH